MGAQLIQERGVPGLTEMITPDSVCYYGIYHIFQAILFMWTLVTVIILYTMYISSQTTILRILRSRTAWIGGSILVGVTIPMLLFHMFCKCKSGQCIYSY